MARSGDLDFEVPVEGGTKDPKGARKHADAGVKGRPFLLTWMISPESKKRLFRETE